MATARNRDYSSPPDTYHSMSANYAWNPYGVVTGATGPNTGVWSSLEMSQDGALRVSLTSGISVDSINISGLVVNTDQLETITTSGTQYLAYLSGISAGSSTVTENRSGILGGTGFYSGLLFAANPTRKEVFVQNVSTVAPSYIRFGSQASAQLFSAILNPSTVSGQGGGSLSSEIYKGAVYFSGGSINAFEI